MTYSVTANQRLYTLVDDLTDRFQVIVTGRITSAEWNLPLATFQIEVDRPDVFVKILPTGYFALAGKIPVLFPELAMQAYALQITVSAPGHEGASATVNVPIATNTFPLPEQNFALNYAPIRLQGRVTLAATGAPLVNATVTVDEPNLSTLRAPTRFTHANGTQVNSGALNPSGAIRTVIEAAPPDAQQLRLSTTAGLGGGSILRIGNASAYTYVVLDSVPQPGIVVLRGTPRRSLNFGEEARRVTFVPDGGSQQLTADVPAGIGLLPLNGALGGSALQMADADPLRVEYFSAAALTDTQGYYRLSGIGRRQSIHLRAVDAPALNDAERDWLIDPRQPINTINFSLTPI
jgi:hypothetical protein